MKSGERPNFDDYDPNEAFARILREETGQEIEDDPRFSPIPAPSIHRTLNNAPRRQPSERHVPPEYRKENNTHPISPERHAKDHEHQISSERKKSIGNKVKNLAIYALAYNALLHDELKKTGKKLQEKFERNPEKYGEKKKKQIKFGTRAIAVLAAASTLTVGGFAMTKAEGRTPKNPNDGLRTPQSDEVLPPIIYDDEKSPKIVYDDYDTPIVEVASTSRAEANTKHEEPTTEAANSFEDSPEEFEEFTIPTVAHETAEPTSSAFEENDSSAEMIDIFEPGGDATAPDKTEKSPEAPVKMDLEFNLKLTDSMKSELETIKKTYKEHFDTYKTIAEQASEKTGLKILPEMVCAIHYRESSCDFDTYLHNGQKLGKKTTLVPRNIFFGHGEFIPAAVSAIEGEMKQFKNNARSYDIKDDLSTISSLMMFTETFNGLGARMYHDNVSSYVNSGTDRYEKGRYVSDGKWSDSSVDNRVGTLAIMSTLFGENAS